MNQIDNIMQLADEYATSISEVVRLEYETWHSEDETNRTAEQASTDRQALRAAIEQALAVQPEQEPVALAEQYARSHAKFLFKAPQPQPKQEPVAEEPEIVQRIKRRAGKTLREVRNPNVTARESIELANWLVANAQPQPKQEPGLHGATHRQPITGGLYKQIGGVWYVWSRIENEPKSWIKSPGTHESGLEKISAAPQPQNCGTPDLTAECKSLRRELRIAVAIIQSEYPEEQWPDYRVPEMLAALKE